MMGERCRCKCVIDTYGIEIWNACGRKAVSNFLRCYNRTDWMPVSHGFGNRHYIGHHILCFKCPVMCADASESDLHLVGNNNTTGTTYNSANRMRKLHKMTLVDAVHFDHTHTMLDVQITCKHLQSSLRAVWFDHHNFENSQRCRRRHPCRSPWYSGKSIRSRPHTIASADPAMNCIDWICRDMCLDKMPTKRKWIEETQ